MAVKRTRSGYQLWWYDADGRFRKRTIRGISRDEAARIEREILAARDRGARPMDERDAPLFEVRFSRVRQLLTRLQDRGLSARRINLTLLVLKMILGTAARWRLLRDDST